MQDIDQILAQAKERRKTAETVEAMQNAQNEGLLGGPEKREISAYERAAETITGGLHKVDQAKSTLQHANIPSKVIAPVLEIIITTEAMIQELKSFRREHTLDDLTLEENRILVEEAVRIMESIPIILTAKDGFRSIQAVENLRSLVTGESMMRANEAGAYGLGQSKGILSTIKGFFVGGKK